MNRLPRAIIAPVEVLGSSGTTTEPLKQFCRWKGQLAIYPLDIFCWRAGTPVSRVSGCQLILSLFPSTSLSDFEVQERKWNVLRCCQLPAEVLLPYGLLAIPKFVCLWCAMCVCVCVWSLLGASNKSAGPSKGTAGRLSDTLECGA